MKKITTLIAVLMIFASACVPKPGETLRPYVETDSLKIEEYKELFGFDNDSRGFIYGEAFYLADLNDDGNYEILLTYWQGSGIISSSIECYEKVSGTFSLLDERIKTDYTLYIYEDELYIIATQNFLSSLFQPPRVYTPVLVDNQLSFESIDGDMESKIFESYKNDNEDIPWAYFD